MSAPEGTFDDNRVAGIYPACPICIAHTLEPAEKITKLSVMLRCTICYKPVIYKDTPPRGCGWYRMVGPYYSPFECNWAKGTIISDDHDDYESYEVEGG